jgi:ribose-1,5-bisphosphate isomerase, e2b2 family
VFGAIESTASEIKEMRIRGAGRIARAAAAAMRDFASGYSGASLNDLMKDIDTAKDILLNSRPTAVSLRNGIYACINNLDEAGSLKDAKDLISDNAERFIETSLKAVETISKIGAKRIADGDVLMTHCNSSAALGVIKEAHRQGRDIKVFATESRPWRQGILTVNELAKEGLDITLIIDSAVRMVMEKVDMVFVGADTVTSNGVLINKIGTSQLALAADEARSAFNVCTETYKFSPLTMSGNIVPIEERDHSEVAKPNEIDGKVKIFNPVFDSTPSKYIDAMITEVGIISPGSVYDVILRQFGSRVMEDYK